MANELPTNVYGQQADPLLPNAFDFPGESQSQDLFQQILKKQKSQQTFDPLNVKESFNEVKDRFFSAGKLDFIDEDDPALFTAYKRSMDYLMDMGLAGLGTADTAIRLAVTAVAQPLRLISDENAERFSRDTMGLIEYAGTRVGAKNLTEIDDALDSGIDVLNKTYKRAMQEGPMPTTYSFSGNLIPTYKERTSFTPYKEGKSVRLTTDFDGSGTIRFRDPFGMDSIGKALSTIDIPEKGILGEDLLRRLKKIPEITPELIPESIELNKKYTLNDLFDLRERKFEGLFSPAKYVDTQRQTPNFGLPISLDLGSEKIILGGELGYFETKINYTPEVGKKFARKDTGGVYDSNTIAHVRGSLHQHYMKEQESLKGYFDRYFSGSYSDTITPDTSKFDSIIFPSFIPGEKINPGEGTYILAEEIQSKLLNPSFPSKTTSGIREPLKDATGKIIGSEDELFNNMFNIPVIEDAGVFKVDDLRERFSKVKTDMFENNLRSKGFYTDAMAKPGSKPGSFFKNVIVPDNFKSEVKDYIKGVIDFKKELEAAEKVARQSTYFGMQEMYRQRGDILNIVKKYAPKNDPDLKGFIDVDNGNSFEEVLIEGIKEGNTNLFLHRSVFSDQEDMQIFSEYLVNRLTDEYVRNIITDIPEFSYMKSLNKIEDSDVMDTVDLPELDTDEFDDFLETYVAQGKKPSVAFEEEYGRDMLDAVMDLDPDSPQVRPRVMLSEFLSSTQMPGTTANMPLYELKKRLEDLDERYEVLIKDKFGSVEVAEQVDTNYRHKRNNLKDIFNYYKNSYESNLQRYESGKKYVSSPISNNQDISDQALKVLIQKAAASGAKFIVLPSVSGQILSRSTRNSDAIAEGIKFYKLRIRILEEQFNASNFKSEKVKNIIDAEKEKLSELQGSQFYRLYEQAVNNSVADLERNYPVVVHRNVPLPYNKETVKKQIINPENLNGTVIDVRKLIEDFDVESPRFGGTIMTAASDAQELGFTKPVFHYTMAKGGQFEGDIINPEFNVKTNEFGYAYRGDPFDQLGVHVGTLKAAQDRGMSQMKELLGGYGYYGTPDFSDKDEVAALGRFMKMMKAKEGIDIELGSVVPLMADLSKPLQGEALGLGYTDIRTVLDKDGKPRFNKAGEEITQKKFVPASENQVRGFINEKIEEFKKENPDRNLTQREIVELIAEDLGKQGYTHIPYTNEIEDVNSTSMIMLTNRPDKKAVLRSKFAKFSPRDQMSEELGKYQGGLI